jgi:hypothetical protein
MRFGFPVFSSSLIAFCVALPLQAETLPASSGHGLDAMAPAGRWAARVELRVNSYDRWYDSSGNEEKFNADYDGLDLNASVFPALALLGPGASLGTTSLYTKQDLQAAQIVLGYGLSEEVTLGFIFPFVKTSTKVDFSVAGGNVGFNPAFDPNQPIGPGNFPFAPVGGGATAPVGTAGVKQLLTDPVFGYGYAPVENSTSSGLSDPTVGVLWRFYKDPQSSLVIGTGIRFGTAKGDDPDSLVDIPIGDGTNDIRLRLEYFRDLGGDFDLHLLAENFTQLAHDVDMRVPQSGQLLAPASSKERLRRDPGDYQEYDLELGHHWGDWRVSATRHLYIRGKDSYRSDLGTDTSALEANTNVRADQWRAGVSWSGINAWRQGIVPLPMIVKLEMQETYGGYNFPKVRDFYLQVTSFF